MTDRRCEDCPYRPVSRAEGAVMTFVFFVGALTIVLCVGLVFRWLFTYVL